MRKRKSQHNAKRKGERNRISSESRLRQSYGNTGTAPMQASLTDQASGCMMQQLGWVKKQLKLTVQVIIALPSALCFVWTQLPK